MPSVALSRLRAVAGGCLVGCALAILPDAASAHPHVWVSARAAVRLSADNRLVGIEETWTFDREYSAFATLNLDPDRPGGPGPGKLADLARTQLASLAEYRYFTRAKANGGEVAFGTPQETALVFRDGRLTLSFFLPASEPAKLRVLSLALDDESFFVAFNVAREADAVRVTGAGKGCALNVRRPEADAEEGRQVIPDSEAALSDKAVQAGTDYLTRIVLACP